VSTISPRGRRGRAEPPARIASVAVAVTTGLLLVVEPLLAPVGLAMAVLLEPDPRGSRSDGTAGIDTSVAPLSG
jgi:hypothetical protein